MGAAGTMGISLPSGDELFPELGIYPGPKGTSVPFPPDGSIMVDEPV